MSLERFRLALDQVGTVMHQRASGRDQLAQ
jgi:hypothetical protein